jgi:hypothetical protein
MIDEGQCELRVLPVSATDTVGDHRYALRYLDLSKRCLVLIRDIAEHAALCWDDATVDLYFQDLRAILAPTTLEERFRHEEAGDEMSSLELIHVGLLALHEPLMKETRRKCH